MIKQYRHIVFVLLVLVVSSLQSYAISDKIPVIKSYFIPRGAEIVATGYGWIVYKEDTETTDFFTACKLYLENRSTGERYKLLETKGDYQEGTRLPIKARNKLAYGNNEVETKPNASYEYGYIEAVDEVFVLAGNKILLSGIPDARNYYNYVIDLDTYSAVHIPAYDEYVRTVEPRDNVKYLEFLTPEYTSSGRTTVRVWYDIQGNLIKNLGAPRKYSSNRYRMVFYIWHSGDQTSSGKSAFGHAFVFIPQIGYVGYGGSITDHRTYRPYATDSCVVYISEESLYAVKEKFREWQRMTPTYVLMRHDCTSFALDMADAAGIKYGNRLLIQWPADFMEGLLKYNSSNQTKPIDTVNSNFKSDLIGQIVRDPSEDGYFPEEWSWQIKEDEVLSVSELSRRSATDGNTYVNVLAHLHRGELKVDVEMELVYQQISNGGKLLYSSTKALTIPSQPDYSNYIEMKMEYDFFPTLVAYNNSDYTLFVAGDYTVNSTERFATIIEPHSSANIMMMGDAKSYHIHFAYRK